MHFIAYFTLHTTLNITHICVPLYLFFCIIGDILYEQKHKILDELRHRSEYSESEYLHVSLY